jgi:hypothetical protein
MCVIKQSCCIRAGSCANVQPFCLDLFFYCFPTGLSRNGHEDELRGRGRVHKTDPKFGQARTLYPHMRVSRIILYNTFCFRSSWRSR